MRFGGVEAEEASKLPSSRDEAVEADTSFLPLPCVVGYMLRHRSG